MAGAQDYQNVNYVSYCTNSIGTVVWTIDLVLLLRNQNKMKRLTFQTVLMIIYHITALIQVQTVTLFVLQSYGEQPQWYNERRCTAIFIPAEILCYASFGVAHWMFAYDYWRLSYKNKLKNEKMPAYTNECGLNLLFYTVCIIVVLLSIAIGFIEPFSYRLFLILFGCLEVVFMVEIVLLCTGFC